MEELLDHQTHRVMEASRCREGVLYHDLVQLPRMLPEQSRQVRFRLRVVEVEGEALDVKVSVVGESQSEGTPNIMWIQSKKERG